MQLTINPLSTIIFLFSTGGKLIIDMWMCGCVDVWMHKLKELGSLLFLSHADKLT